MFPMGGAIERPTEGDFAAECALSICASHWKQCKFAADLNFKSFMTLLTL